MSFKSVKKAKAVIYIIVAQLKSMEALLLSLLFKQNEFSLN